jgi:hypothetical protein
MKNAVTVEYMYALRETWNLGRQMSCLFIEENLDGFFRHALLL